MERELATKLAEWRLKNPTTRLVFGTDDKVEGHFLLLCKPSRNEPGWTKPTSGFTSSAIRSQRGACGAALTSVPFNTGWATRTSAWRNATWHRRRANRRSVESIRRSTLTQPHLLRHSLREPGIGWLPALWYGVWPPLDPRAIPMLVHFWRLLWTGYICSDWCRRRLKWPKCAFNTKKVSILDLPTKTPQ